VALRSLISLNDTGSSASSISASPLISKRKLILSEQISFKPSNYLSAFLSKKISARPNRNERKQIITLVNRGYDNYYVISNIIGEINELIAEANSGIVIITPIAYFFYKKKYKNIL